MNSILITGSKNAGKSTTMRVVCSRLKPSKVYKLNINEEWLSRVDGIVNAHLKGYTNSLSH